MDSTDIFFQILIAAGVLAIILHRRRMEWDKLILALLVIAGLTWFIDVFILT